MITTARGNSLELATTSIGRRKHAVGISWGHPLAPVAGVAAHHPLATTMLVVIMLALVASIGLATAECNGEDCKEETCP